MLPLHGEGFGPGPIKVTLDKVNGPALNLVPPLPPATGPIFDKITVQIPVNVTVGNHTVFASQTVGGKTVEASAVLNIYQTPQ